MNTTHPEVTTTISMTLAEVYADLGSVNEVADTLGVGIYRVRRWIDRRRSTNCPCPVRTLSGINIYSLTDWQGWFALWKATRGTETWNRRPSN